MELIPHGHGLVQNELDINEVVLLTLGPRVAIALNTQFNNPTASFLMKRVRYFTQIALRTASDNGPILIGCANGDATVTEIAEAMNERNVNGPDDITNVLDQDKTWVVYQNTVVPMEIQGDQTYGQATSRWINFGGKNGIPAIEGSGMQVFAYNAGGAALTTGSLIDGIVQVQGVWLRD